MINRLHLNLLDLDQVRTLVQLLGDLQLLHGDVSGLLTRNLYDFYCVILSSSFVHRPFYHCAGSTSYYLVLEDSQFSFAGGHDLYVVAGAPRLLLHNYYNPYETLPPIDYVTLESFNIILCQLPYNLL